MRIRMKPGIVDKVIGVALMIVVGVMPLIVHIVQRPVPAELLPYFTEFDFPDGLYVDMFAYWKGVLVLIPAIVIGIYVLSDWATKGRLPDFREIFRQPPVVISLVYIGLVIISALASPYTRTAWFGTIMRSEGTLMWLAYFVVFFAAIFFARRVENATVILYGLAFSSIIMGVIGVSQFVGRDLIGTGFAGWLITGGRGTITPVFQIAYGTLFNPNTFGKYTAMVAPVLLLAALTYTGKKYVNLIFLAGGALMLVGVFGSSSLGGLVGIVTAAGVLVITFVFSRGISAKRLGIAALPVIGALVLAVLFIPPLNYRVNFLFTRMGTAMRAETTHLHDYVFAENTMTVYRGGGKLLSLEVHGLGSDWLTVRCGAGSVIEPALREVPPVERHEDGTIAIRPTLYAFEIPGYRTVFIDKFPELFRYYHPTPVPFWLTLIDGRIYATTPGGLVIDLHEQNPAWGFEGRETWGSSRGYIWSRSFPLMFTPRALTIGYGSDTFINAFPSHDIVSRQRFFNEPYMFIDKAHNIVLQTWISTGALSAIALLALFGHYLLTTFMSLVKNKREKNKAVFLYGLRLGLLCGISAYVMSSMATDTTIGSTGVFFVLLGVGYGLNFKARENV